MTCHSLKYGPVDELKIYIIFHLLYVISIINNPINAKGVNCLHENKHKVHGT